MPEDLPTSAPEPSPPPTYGPPVSSPASRTSPWVWVAVAMSALALVATVVVPLVLFFAFGPFMGFNAYDDELEDDYPGYYVEQESVLDAVEEPCEEMLEAAEDVTVMGPTDKAAASLHRWTTVAQGIVTAIDGAEPNSDSREWRDDWKATIKAVNSFADNLGKPNNQLNLPDVESMYYETDAECGVPIVIAALDQEWAGYFLGE